MAKEKKKVDKDSALVTGRSVSNNANLDNVVASIAAGYKPNRQGKSTRQIRIDHTAMIENTKDVWAYRSVDGGAKVPRLVFRAGWYISPEEAYIREQILADTDNKKLNDHIQKEMEAAGLVTEKRPAEIEDAKVVGV